MKPLLSRLPLPLLVLGLLAFLWGMLRWLDETQRDVGAQERVAQVARLLDADTTLLIHLPDLNAASSTLRTAHFTKLGIHHGIRELAHQVLTEIPELDRWETHWDQCQRMNISHAALAITQGPGGWEWVIVFQSDAAGDPLWKSCLDWWQADAASGDVRIVDEERQGARFVVASLPDRRLARLRWNGWHLTSNSPDALDHALSRLQDPGLTETNVLAGQRAFQENLTSLRSDYLALAYVTRRKTDSVKTNTPDEERRPGRLDRLDRFLKRMHAGSAALTLNLHQGQMIENVAVLTEDTFSPGTGANATTPLEATLSLTSPRTLAYATSNVGSESVRRFLLEQFMKRWKASKIPALESVAAGWESCFDANWAVQLEPIETLSTQETAPAGEPLAALLAFGLRDSTALRAHLETLADTKGSGIRRSAAQSYLLDHALLPSVLTNLLEEIHLHVDHGLLIVGDQIRGIHQVTRRWDLGRNLGKRGDVQLLLDKLPSPDAGLAFIDAGPILQRGSEALQHPLVYATLWMGIRSQTNLEIDFQRLHRSLRDDIEVIPTLATWQQTPQGHRLASRGTLSPLQWFVGGSALVATIDKTFLESTPLTETDSFGSPPIEEELLRMMDP